VVSGECDRNGCGGRRLRGGRGGGGEGIGGDILAGVLVGAKGLVGVPCAVYWGCGLGEMGWQGGEARGSSGGKGGGGGGAYQPGHQPRTRATQKKGAGDLASRMCTHHTVLNFIQ
jgi:hypothetical protein